jgi:ankyrin repeat protein
MDDYGVISLVEAFETSLREGCELAAARPHLVNERTGLGETALHLLVLGKSLDGVRELLKLGANVNALSELGTTPLSDAASLGSHEIVSILLQSGASVAVEGQFDPTLHQAVRSGSNEVVRLILDAGADVNLQGDLSEAAIHIAVEDDKVEIAKLLLSRGANPLLKRIFDETALDVAHKVGSNECIALLSTKH